MKKELLNGGVSLFINSKKSKKDTKFQIYV